jgi:hypothetical protein
MVRQRGKVPKCKWRYYGSDWNNKAPSEEEQKIRKFDFRVSSEDPGAISSFYVDLFRARPCPENIEYVSTGLTLNVSGASPAVIGRISNRYKNCRVYRL